MQETRGDINKNEPQFCRTSYSDLIQMLVNKVANGISNIKGTRRYIIHATLFKLCALQL